MDGDSGVDIHFTYADYANPFGSGFLYSDYVGQLRVGYSTYTLSLNSQEGSISVTPTKSVFHTTKASANFCNPYKECIPHY